MKFTLTCALVLALTSAAVHDTVTACTCEASSGAPRELVQAAKRSATAVFVGTVTDMRTDFWGMQVMVRFSVERFWKGRLGAEVTITTHAQSSACGYQFAPGGRYIVYCYGDPSGALSTDICTRTRGDGDARDEVRYLGRSKRPAIPRTTPN